MPLTIQELNALKDDLRRARELVDQGFASAKAAGETALARHLRDIGLGIGDCVADLEEREGTR